MDRRLKTTFIALALPGLILLTPGLAIAQQGNNFYPDYRDDEAPVVQRNQELPKGLTLVPWKIQQRTSLEEIRSGKTNAPPRFVPPPTRSGN